MEKKYVCKVSYGQWQDSSDIDHYFSGIDHNLYFYNTMMEEIREAIEQERYQSYKEEKLYGMMGR